ncbi:serine carboxypeptidase-like 45 [Malania oleifera]|uniref:serine carboxypeptidase-like 45 n=1 Tax=Malania oleifera TaxID=397392 RepID=UPI0025AE3CDD|nr:serine carboxypeptidase-like 45 [Malania oleifera]
MDLGNSDAHTGGGNDARPSIVGGSDSDVVLHSVAQLTSEAKRLWKVVKLLEEQRPMLVAMTWNEVKKARKFKRGLRWEIHEWVAVFKVHNFEKLVDKAVVAEASRQRSAGQDKIAYLPGQPRVSFQQYAGYVQVDSKLNRSMFYYFVEAETNPASKPLVLWFTGGPPCSSLGVGAFMEIGPFKLQIPYYYYPILTRNEYSWNTVANMLYVESPVGVGFSYSVTKSFYSSVTDNITAQDNFSFLVGWLAKFSEYKSNALFLAGESYAGHYVPQLAELILNHRLPNMNVNLQGIILGGPLLEFEASFDSAAEYLWAHGIITSSSLSLLNSNCSYSQYRREYQILRAISTECAMPCFLISHDLINIVDLQQPKQSVDVCIVDKIFRYLNRKDVQKALHAQLVGVNYWNICSSVVHYEYKDFEIPTLDLVGTLLKNDIKVLIYSGDQDAVIPLLGTRSLVEKLANELGLEITVPYRNWFNGDQVGGWIQVYDSRLFFATVREESHFTARSQPERSLVLFAAFIEGKPPPDYH